MALICIYLLYNEQVALNEILSHRISEFYTKDRRPPPSKTSNLNKIQVIINIQSYLYY
jgi:hypothetical protein